MKKAKSILFASVTVVMALIMSLAVGCAGGSSCKKKPKEEVTKTLQSIELDLSAVKTEYYIGEEFTTQGLAVKAKYLTSKNETVTEDVALNDRNLSINSSGYNKNVQGTYTINISFRNSGITKSDSYTVNVMIEHIGLNVTLKESAPKSIDLSVENTTADLSAAASWIEVRKPDGKGNVDMTAAPVAASEYTVKVYLGKTELTAEQLKSCKMGTYQIWASMPYDDDYTLEGFATVTVYDALVKLEFKSGTKFEQEISGSDVMSSTWTYEATFVSGDKKTLTSKDVKVTGINTSTATENGVATVSYTHRGVTETTTVNYKIKALTGEVNYNVTYKSDGSKLVAEWTGLQGTSSQLTVSGSGTHGTSSPAKYTEDEAFTGTDYIQVKGGKEITVTLGNAVKDGSVNITIYTSHSNKTSTRTVTMSKNGEASVTASVALAAVEGVAPPYIVLLTLQNQSKGTYTVTADDTCYVYAIVVTYTVDYGSGN